MQQGKKTLELPINPVVHRGQDPELFWLNKYGNDDREELLRVDIRSLYRHEHIAPETLIKNLYSVTETKNPQLDLFSVNELFGNALEKDELEKVSEYYHHQDGWTNRLIQGDSQLVMASLLEREGMAGQVQTIYFDPPYGIKYGSNWQIKLNNRDVKDGNDEALTGEPEQIKAFRDTWELGIHSYLSYLRDRLLIAKELLTENGSCFVQISDENVHLVRSIMDEVFGSENFVSMITFRKTGSKGSEFVDSVCDYIIFYAKDKTKLKYRQLFIREKFNPVIHPSYSNLMLKNGKYRVMTFEEKNLTENIPADARPFQTVSITSQEANENSKIVVEHDGVKYYCPSNRHWSVDPIKIPNAIKKGYVKPFGNTLRRISFFDEEPGKLVTNIWDDLMGSDNPIYVVQTSTRAIQRCLLMTTDPGDLVLDPTCGSGTTAFVAEQFGRRWITIDTSRIALNIAKQRLMTAVFPFYLLYDSPEGQAFLKKQNPTNLFPITTNHSHDIRQGFIYKTVPHITLKSLANDEPPATETLYDKPETDNKKLRVSGPFTVETLQNFEPTAPEALEEEAQTNDETTFAQVVKSHFESAGIKNGRKDEQVVFLRVELLSHPYLHAEGFYQNGAGEKKAYLHIGPKFGTVSRNAVNEAVKECRLRGDAQWLIILGFSFESGIEGSTQTMNMGKFEVTKARIHDDLMQDGLKKKPGKSAASFVTIGEPDILLVDSGQWLADSNKKILSNYDIFKKLSGTDSLAKVNGLSQADLSAYLILSQRRDVWIDFANAQSSSKHSGKHSGRTGEEQHERIPSVFGNSQRFFFGIDDFDNLISQLELSDERKFRKFIEELRRSRQDAEWLNEITFSKELTTHHYTLTTIKGLDIYDPIKDEVKARNVSDIAYWMVDDDYDGSNFIVKQVFFCGGDKDEFAKWKKGLESLSKDGTKKKVEKTLKIEIDDEAFDRLYGHISHPIEVKKKGQKIAVRVISQFGEETTKVLTV